MTYRDHDLAAALDLVSARVDALETRIAALELAVASQGRTGRQDARILAADIRRASEALRSIAHGLLGMLDK